jgi:hypothetical protein
MSFKYQKLMLRVYSATSNQVITTKLHEPFENILNRLRYETDCTGSNLTHRRDVIWKLKVKENHISSGFIH